jgi:hypothetical protein
MEQLERRVYELESRIARLEANDVVLRPMQSVGGAPMQSKRDDPNIIRGIMTSVFSP